MLEIFLHLIVTSGLLLVVAYLVSGIQVDSWGAAFIGAIMLGIVNALIYPIAKFLAFPLTVLTLGLFLLVVNALMLQLAAAFTPGVKVEGCGAALVGAILLAILNTGVSMLTGL